MGLLRGIVVAVLYACIIMDIQALAGQWVSYCAYL